MLINKLEVRLYYHTGTGKTKRVLVFAKGAKAAEAEAAGADFVGAE